MFRLALIHLRRYIKNPVMMIMMLPLPLGLIFFSLQFGHSQSGNPEVAIVMQSQGIYEEALIECLNIDEDLVFVKDATRAIEKLKVNDLAGVLVLPENFSEVISQGVKPQLEILKTSEGAGTLGLETLVEDQVNTWLKESYGVVDITPVKSVIHSPDEKLDVMVLMFVMMCLYFMFIGATMLAKDLMVLKQQNVLARALSTANKNYQIMGGLILAMCLIEGILFSIVYYVGVTLLQVELTNFIMPVILMFSMAFVAASLVIFITRVVKNQSLIEMSIVVYGLAGFIISLVAMNLFTISANNDLLLNIAMLFPIYWGMDAAFNQTIWPNIPIILLFGVAFLTAGSLKLNRFVKS